MAFQSSFIFSMARVPGSEPGHGIAFLFSPLPGLQDAIPAQHMGLFSRYSNGNRTNRVLAIEFDVFRNEEFSDIDDNHVGVDLFSLTSVVSRSAGYWPDGPSSSFVKLKLNDGSNYQAWVDYEDGRLNVTMAPAGKRKPLRPLIWTDLDLSEVFLDDMYVGFCAATGVLVEHHRILSWSFSNHNSSLSEALVTSNLPSFRPPTEGGGLPKGVVAGISAAGVVVFLLGSACLLLVWRRRRNQKKMEAAESGGGGEEAAEEWEMEYWPHRIPYREISTATDAFSELKLIGCGGNGKVYRGDLRGAQVAVKVFARNSEEDFRQFAAEVSSLGRLKHRNLNGSLERWIFPGEGAAKKPLDWQTKMKILKDVAAGVLYLHEGWEVRVLHRDIKASNVMLDGAMNARLGDFGLARTHPHGGGGLGTSRVVGSVGYMAPEVMHSGKASAATDVYGFGVLVLEVVCGRRAVEEGRAPLVDWVWGLAEKGKMLEAVDTSLLGAAEHEVGWVLQLGLSCTSVDQTSRPSMLQVVRALEGPYGAPWEKETEEKVGAEAALLARGAVASTTRAWGRSISSRPGLMTAVKQQQKLQHLTFEELRQSVSCSTSLSSSDVIVEGR
ncbi:unnamed protein product [Spirodela intermedia]|uniref:non-specific serine/threonine protein kinase n=1 Tax=Spirodela intermedia TaxID=51605 RepID=A0A7I8J6I2_SPIIN|nr:unnamed protein product [Spirodela intermedia]CAA6665711.1 unnamed protein product [Spirodela intermedia]